MHETVSTAFKTVEPCQPVTRSRRELRTISRPPILGRAESTMKRPCRVFSSGPTRTSEESVEVDATAGGTDAVTPPHCNARRRGRGKLRPAPETSLRGNVSIRDVSRERKGGWTRQGLTRDCTRSLVCFYYFARTGVLWGRFILNGKMEGRRFNICLTV